jgi:RHS repeat-associated protein
MIIPMRLHVQVSGSSPTTIRARAWKAGTTEPATWAIDTTDNTPANQVAGGAYGIESQNYSATDNDDWSTGDDLLVTTGSGGGGPDTTAPTTPTGLTAVAAGPARVNLAWTAATDAVGVQGYRLYRDGAYLATVGSTGWSDLGLSGATAYAYTVAAVDAAGNASSGSTAASATTAASSQATTTYTYDDNGNRLTASDGTLVITATYDRLGRVLTVDDEDAGTAADTSYTYSLTSPSWTDPTGTYLVTLDKFDRAIVLDDTGPATGTSTWSFRADGQPASVGQPNGNTTSFGYDGVGDLTGKDTTGGGTHRAQYTWTVNRAGQVLSETSTVTGDASNGSVTYAYDPLGRLTGFAPTGGTATTYGWDASLNRTSVTAGGTAYPTTYDAANRPKDQNGVTDAFSSDADGNLTARPTQAGTAFQQLTWDQLGRLTAVRNGSGTVISAYTYDPLDRLHTIADDAGHRTRLRYAGLTTSVAQWLDDVGGTVTRNVATAWSGEPLADWTPSGGTAGLRVYGTNAHHDVTWLARSDGTVQESLRYDPWGSPRVTPTTSYTPFRFQGSWHDTAAELAWVVTRWYAPAMGRFISEDSLLGEPREPDSRHLYAYAAGDPVGSWDPEGRAWRLIKSREIDLSDWEGFARTVAVSALAGLACLSYGIAMAVCQEQVLSGLLPNPEPRTTVEAHAIVRQRVFKGYFANAGQIIMWQHQIGVRTIKKQHGRVIGTPRTEWASGNSVEYIETFVSARMFTQGVRLDHVGQVLDRRYHGCAEGLTLQWGYDRVKDARASDHGQCRPWAAAIYTWSDPVRYSGVAYALSERWNWERFYTNKGRGFVTPPGLRW